MPDPRIISFDDQIIMARLPDGSVTRVARTPKLDKMFQIEIGEAQIEPEFDVELGPAEIEPDVQVEIGQAQLEPEFDVEIGQAEVETPQEELERAQRQVAESVLRRFK